MRLKVAGSWKVMWLLRVLARCQGQLNCRRQISQVGDAFSFVHFQFTRLTPLHLHYPGRVRHQDKMEGAERLNDTP